jgi:hypothetical protein
MRTIGTLIPGIKLIGNLPTILSCFPGKGNKKMCDWEIGQYADCCRELLWDCAPSHSRKAGPIN